jgi:hypothetical protein
MRVQQCRYLCTIPILCRELHGNNKRHTNVYYLVFLSISIAVLRKNTVSPLLKFMDNYMESFFRHFFYSDETEIMSVDVCLSPIIP